MKRPWQTTFLRWLYYLGLLSLIRLFLLPQPGFKLLLHAVCLLAMVVCFYRGRRLGWFLAVAFWAYDLYWLAWTLFYWATHGFPASFPILYLGLVCAIRVLLYGCLTFCRPTRAYFNLGRARAVLEEKARRVLDEGRQPGKGFSRLSARLHHEEYVPAEEPLPDSPLADPPCHTQADLWLDAAERLEPLVAPSEAEGDFEGLAEALPASFPPWARQAGDIRALLDRALSQARRDLDGYALYPRKGVGAGEAVIGENQFIVTLTLEQAAEGGPYRAAAQLRVNWEPSP